MGKTNPYVAIASVVCIISLIIVVITAIFLPSQIKWNLIVVGILVILGIILATIMGILSLTKKSR